MPKLNDKTLKDTLTNAIVSFEQLDPGYSTCVCVSFQNISYKDPSRLDPANARKAAKKVM